MDFPSQLITTLRAAQRVAALTGAGISQESGLRTFRGVTSAPPPEQAANQPSRRPEELASPEGFRRDPKLVWDWYAMRRGKVAEVQPNPGHYALAEMARRIPEFTLITQNVDGLHGRAGSPQVIELHGNIQRVRCFEDDEVFEAWEEGADGVGRCPKCGGLLRPDVVWFGEALPRRALEAAVLAARRCEVFFSIGTSGVVQPAASLAYAARNRGASVVEVNLEPTPLTAKADFALPGRSGEILPALVRAVWGE